MSSMAITAEQKAAVNHAGVSLVVAVPGSGKTRTLIAKIMHLVNQGLSPVFVITFTKDAATELMHRLKDIYGCDWPLVQSRIVVGTFHAIFLRHLMANGLQFAPPSRQAAILHSIYVTKHGSAQGYEDFEAAVNRVFAGVPLTSDQNNYTALINEYLEILVNDKSVMLLDVMKTAYEQMAAAKIPLLPARALLVDEGQDVDLIQVQLCELHALAGIPLTFVGDDDQSIYAFRHAVGYSAFQRLKRLPDSAMFVLSTNFRSYEAVLQHAYRLIEHNKSRIAKKWKAHREGVGVVTFHSFVTEAEEAEFMASSISAKLERDETITIAVIGRAGDHLAAVERALTERGVPYVRRGGKGYFDQPACEIYISVLTALAERDEKHLSRALRLFCPTNESNLAWAAAKLILNHRPIEELHVDAPSPIFRAVESLREVENHLSTGSIGVAAEKLASEFGKLLESMASKDSARVSGYRRLGHLARVLAMKQGSLAARLRAIKASKKENQRVTVMTAHASKGLEFDVVHICQFCDGRFPILDKGDKTTAEEIAEERRLAFVAFTRAKNELHVSHSSTVIWVDKKGNQKTSSKEPSRFQFEATNQYV